ncbi:hypothetical protein WSK_3802 [Novosphingobium sp. Rr 2-17]|nr:hypothetical protein WSK_3802 [Novosphingobium sp. Rr 2-17]
MSRQGITAASSTVLGTFAVRKGSDEQAAYLGLDPASVCPGESQEFVGIELDALRSYAARGLMIQVLADRGVVFLDGRGFDVAIANLTKTILVGCIRPQDGNTGYLYGTLLSLVSGSPAIARRETA